MALVDYSSDVEDDDTNAQPQPQHSPNTHSFAAASQTPATTSGPGPGPGTRTTAPPIPPKPAFPPLPSAFHDLYASTVRTAPTDDPSLHQGRTRQTPHIAGNWPTHIYIEWHPDASIDTTLTSLLASLQSRFTPHNINLTSFLVSDLAVPQPLHISLSRPITLTTPIKDSFLSDLTSAISSLGLEPFTLSVAGVEWHRTPESGRSFLVLRVQSSPSHQNPELAFLLAKCNAIVGEYSQPRLYQWADGDPDRISRAFHVSIAWTFEEVTDPLKEVTEEVVGTRLWRGGDMGMMGMSIRVESVKVRIGNVVTKIPLGGRKKEPKPGRA